jgi:hypothetical protein
MKPPRLIALCSPTMGSGKSQVAGRLQQHGFQLVRFAEPLKSMAKALLTEVFSNAVANEALEGFWKEEPIPNFCDVTTRRIMQTLGTEWGRNTIHPDLWVNIACFKIYNQRGLGHPVVVDDLRFKNELDAILERGGKVYRIVRPGQEPYAAHASEGELDGVDMPTIMNDGSLADLLAKADALAGETE